MLSTENNGGRFLRLPEVTRRYGDVSRSTVYQWIKEGRFPAAVKIGPRAAAWPSRALDDHDAKLMAAA